MEEIWKDAPGYNGVYIVSNKGRVASFKWGSRNLMTISIKNNGYYRVCLRKNNKPKYFHIHRLVLLTFKGDSSLDVNHIDGDKSNNNIENLEYCTRSQNIKHAFRLGLSKPPYKGKSGKDIHTSKPIGQYSLSGEFIRSYENSGHAIKDGHNSGIRHCCRGKTKTSGGYIRKFIN